MLAAHHDYGHDTGVNCLMQQEKAVLQYPLTLAFRYCR